MCLQYAIWATASNGHEKYSQYHDVFYKRARQYADNDEMRGYGEHFVTIAHAQTWGLLAMTEARSMLFTRAAMSSAKAVRLVEMMDLHRIDGAGHDVAPTLAPPKDWTDVEERRRVFWGVFTIDCHASISTGWPTLIDPHDITTNLPSSEEAFNECREERTSSLAEAFSGAWYSTFSGPIIICHIFNEILRHVHRTKATDRPEDVDAFMFMPERFRLPKNLRNPTAVHTNLNLHAGIICLHHAAVDKVETYNLPESLRIASQSRLRTAAEEIVNIVRLSSHVSPGFKSPLAALSMYCAVSVYVYIAKISPQSGLSRTDLNNLEFLINAMESIAKNHLITQAFLQQICADVEMNGLASVINLPSLANHRNAFGWSSPNVPLLVKSYLTKHTGIQPPLSGRLPPGNRHPSTARPGQSGSSVEELNDPPGFSDVLPRSAQDIPGKRKRPAQPTQFPENPGAEYDNINFNDVGTHTNESFSRSGRGMYGSGLLRATGVAPRVNTRPVVLPHRTSTTASPSRYNISTPSQATSGETPGPSMGKLEELEKEVLTIKNAVQNAPGLTPSPTPHGRLSGPASGPSPDLSPTTYSSLPERPRAPLPALPSPQNPEREARLAPATGAYLTPTSEPRQPTQPRALGSKVLPAEEVEYYFDQYFKHFHPYFPIVRIREPNRVYAACPILFWTIITVACRAYACDAELFSFLAQNLPREVWAVAMTPPLDLPAINALLVLSAWRFPSAKNSGDPSSSYVAIAMNASLMPGLHTGRGAHREFSNVYLHRTATDEEACYTWTGYNILAQTIASINGYPTPAGYFNEAASRVSGGQPLPETMGYFGLLYEAQKFCNRLSRTVLAVVEDAEGVPDAVLRLLEDDFARVRATLARFTLLAAQLEVQTYALAPVAATPAATLRANVNRLYGTAQQVVEAAVRLDGGDGDGDGGRTGPRFLVHAPYNVRRTVFDAVAVVFDALMSGFADGVEDPDAEVRAVLAVVRRCIVREGDLASWVLRLLET
ncbi:hypothetical protein VD0004_g2932 [Verticillium dahliae]|nr:hypothetical protein VD0004_g2932 [Verticillium dahliae]PNH73436.1 hypothetical protein VD0001_g4121 [Verticillium dahliae]